MLVECSECSHSMSDKAASCPKCGAPTLSKPAIISCAECNTSLNASDETCSQCGAPIERSGPVAETQSPPQLNQPPPPIIIREPSGFKINWEWMAIVGVLAVAVFTKPDNQQLVAMIDAQVRASIQNERITDKDNIFSGIMKLGCAINVAECAQLIKSQIQWSERDIIVAKIATLAFQGNTSTCVGAFKNWWCSDDKK